MNTKQVIIMRKDLNMRKGKMVAQGAHASMAVFLQEGNSEIESQDFWGDGTTTRTLTVDLTEEMAVWLLGKFTKICVSVNSEEELKEIYNKGKELGLPCSLIEDSGLTEFNGVPTITCAAIGPGQAEEIDKITGHLKLL